MWRSTVCLIGVPEGKERRIGWLILYGVIPEDFPEMVKGYSPQIQEPIQISNKINKKESTHSEIVEN